MKLKRKKALYERAAKQSIQKQLQLMFFKLFYSIFSDCDARELRIVHSEQLQVKKVCFMLEYSSLLGSTMASPSITHHSIVCWNIRHY
jgi:hypothetical protein